MKLPGLNDIQIIEDNDTGTYAAIYKHTYEDGNTIMFSAPPIKGILNARPNCKARVEVKKALRAEVVYFLKNGKLKNDL